jgi:hypothetical protein
VVADAGLVLLVPDPPPVFPADEVFEVEVVEPVAVIVVVDGRLHARQADGRAGDEHLGAARAPANVAAARERPVRDFYRDAKG